MCVQFVPAPRLVCIEVNPGPGRKPKARVVRGQHTDDISKGMILGMHLLGASKSKISQELRITRKSVRETINKYEETGQVGVAHGGGRKRKLDRREQQKMAKMAKKGRSARQITDEYQQKTGETIDQKTVRKTLKEGGLAYMKIKKIEKLTAVQKKKRVTYAKEMLEKKFHWKYVLFTDEKTFYLGTEETMAWQDPKNRRVQQTEQYPLKINVWGGIGYYFKTPLFFFDRI